MKAGVLIVGAEGLIGRALLKSAPAVFSKVLGTSRRHSDGLVHLDLQDEPEEFLISDQLDSVIFCSAITNLKECESDPEGTAEVNVRRTIRWIEHFQNAGLFVSFLSTNLVFDGETPDPAPDAPVSPQCEYGRQKVEVETFLKKKELASGIVRLSKVISPDFPLLDSWHEKLINGDEVEAFDDYLLTPIRLDEVSSAILSVTAKKLGGVLHFSSESECSYHALVSMLAERLGKGCVNAVSAKERVPSLFLPWHVRLGGREELAKDGVTFSPAHEVIEWFVRNKEKAV